MLESAHCSDGYHRMACRRDDNPKAQLGNPRTACRDRTRRSHSTRIMRTNVQFGDPLSSSCCNFAPALVPFIHEHRCCEPVIVAARFAANRFSARGGCR
jgi:hypothetical protein